MRQPIKLIIKKGRVRKDGTNLIFVRYCYSSTRRVLIGSDISIPADYWNKKTRTIAPTLPAEYGTPENLQSQLREKLRKTERLVDYALQNATCPIRFLKRNFGHGDLTYLEKVRYDHFKLDVFYQIDRYINDKRDLVQEPTLTGIRCMKKHFGFYIGTKGFLGFMSADGHYKVLWSAGQVFISAE